jgi:hypothetical protein
MRGTPAELSGVIVTSLIYTGLGVKPHGGESIGWGVGECKSRQEELPRGQDPPPKTMSVLSVLQTDSLVPSQNAEIPTSSSSSRVSTS